MTFNLHNIHYFLQTNRGNYYGILKFKPFATSSINSWFPGPLTFSLLLNQTVYSIGRCCRFFFSLDIFCNLRMLFFATSTKISCKFSWNFDIPIICNLVLFFFDGTYQFILFWFYVKPFSNYGNPL